MSTKHQFLSQLNPALTKELLADSTTVTFEKGTEILRQGQYVKVVPIVIEGTIKVFTRQEDRELLLYYIEPNESCVMSFSASLKNQPSQVFATTEENTTVLLLPVSKIPGWMKEFPDINTLFFQQFNTRYTELLDTIHHVWFDSMDVRLYDYLVKKSQVSNQNPIKISHRQIASELGTAREVVSRVMKKIETEGKVVQRSQGIEIL